MPILRTGKSIAQVQRDYNEWRRRLPTYIGTEAVNFYKQSFVRQGFIRYMRVDRWKPRNPTSRDYDRRGRRRGNMKTLIDRGTLEKSIRITNKTANSVKVGTNIIYAQIHNEGGTYPQTVKAHKRTNRRTGEKTIDVRAHTRQMKMPKRQFIGESEFLNRRLERNIHDQLKQVFGID